MRNAASRPDSCTYFSINNKKDLHFCKSCGADTRIRTGDLILTKDALYLLSYISTLLHRATDIYYHIFAENARGNFHFFESFFEKVVKDHVPCLKTAQICVFRAGNLLFVLEIEPIQGDISLQTQGDIMLASKTAQV